MQKRYTVNKFYLEKELEPVDSVIVFLVGLNERISQRLSTCCTKLKDFCLGIKCKDRPIFEAIIVIINLINNDVLI